MGSFSKDFMGQAIATLNDVSIDALEKMAMEMGHCRNQGGRLFILGVGGSAGHASHAVNDFRKICGFEAYAPTDNVSELTARINDEGWEGCFREWLKGSRLKADDALLIFSVGGGSKEKRVSVNLIEAMDHACRVGAKIFAIVGRDGGYAKKVAQTCVVIPSLAPELTTPLTEGIAAVLWHLLVSHPHLKLVQTKWESTTNPISAI